VNDGSPAIEYPHLLQHSIRRAPARPRASAQTARDAAEGSQPGM